MVIFFNLKPNFVYINLLIGKGKYPLCGKKNIRSKILQKNVPGLKNQFTDTLNKKKRSPFRGSGLMALRLFIF